MSAQNTTLAMWAASWIEALSQPGNTLISDTISVLWWAAQGIIGTTWNSINWILGTGAWVAATTGLAAVYWWVKAWEFLDEKFFKFENKWLKWATKVWGGLVWLWYTPIAAPIWLWIAAYKGWKWAVKWLWNWAKSLWNRGYSKKFST